MKNILVNSEFDILPIANKDQKFNLWVTEEINVFS